MENTQNLVVNEKQAAAYLGLAVQTLRNRRFLRKPPTYYKVGCAVRYRVRDLEAYLSSCRISPEKDGG